MKILFKVVLLTLMLTWCASALADDLSFEWEQDMTIAIDGWKLFMSETSSNYDYGVPFATIVYDGNPTGTYTTTQTVNIPPDSEVTKYFVLRVYNNIGDSESSNEVSITFDTRVPSPPFSLTVEIVGTE